MIALILLFALNARADAPSAPAPTATTAAKTDAKTELGCRVDGHGPYKATEDECIKLGQAQAHTRCVLDNKSTRIRLDYIDAKTTHLGLCESSLNKQHDDCDTALCQWK